MHVLFWGEFFVLFLFSVFFVFWFGFWKVKVEVGPEGPLLFFSRQERNKGQFSAVLTGFGLFLPAPLSSIAFHCSSSSSFFLLLFVFFFSYYSSVSSFQSFIFSLALLFFSFFLFISQSFFLLCFLLSCFLFFFPTYFLPNAFLKPPLFETHVPFIFGLCCCSSLVFASCCLVVLEKPFFGPS